MSSPSGDEKALDGMGCEFCGEPAALKLEHKKSVTVKGKRALVGKRVYSYVCWGHEVIGKKMTKNE